MIISTDVIFDVNSFYKTNPIETTFKPAFVSSLFTNPLTKDKEHNDSKTQTNQHQSPATSKIMLNWNKKTGSIQKKTTPTSSVNQLQPRFQRKTKCSISQSWMI
jgi:hypothetical protein